MKYQDLVSSFIATWNFTRAETLEILNSLDNEQLQFKPQGEKWQTLYWQFGCIARTQLVYAKAIETGKIDFSLFESEKLPKKDQYQTKVLIKNFLEEANQTWLEAIQGKSKDEDFKITWPGYNQNLLTHISSLISHERLHHGQLISYFTLAGFELPPGFK